MLLKYPPIKGLEEEVPVEVEVLLKRKRKQILPKASEPLLPEAKKLNPLVPLIIRTAVEAREKKTSEVPWEKVPEPLRKPTTQPFPSKLTAHPKKLRTEKGKGKVDDIPHSYSSQAS